MSDMFADHGPFKGVVLRDIGGKLEEYVTLPERDSVLDALEDLLCVSRRCECHKKPRNVSCLRGMEKPPWRDDSMGLIDYVDNSLGFRAIPGKT